MPPQPPPQKPYQQAGMPIGVARGNKNACPCPHCGGKNDLREIDTTGMLEKEATLECDHCHHMFDVVAIQPIVVVTVKRSPRDAELRQRRVARRDT